MQVYVATLIACHGYTVRLMGNNIPNLLILLNPFVSTSNGFIISILRLMDNNIPNLQTLSNPCCFLKSMVSYYLHPQAPSRPPEAQWPFERPRVAASAQDEAEVAAGHLV